MCIRDSPTGGTYCGTPFSFPITEKKVISAEFYNEIIAGVTNNFLETFFNTAEKSTSPTSLPAKRLIPTSMTTELSFTISAVTKFGFPIAAIRISADRARLDKSFVRE